MRSSSLVALLAGLASLALAGCETVPITGRSQLMLVSEPEENRMGIQAYREILRKSRVSRDPVLNQVTRVGTRIAAAAAANPELIRTIWVHNEGRGAEPASRHLANRSGPGHDE